MWLACPLNEQKIFGIASISGITVLSEVSLFKLQHFWGMFHQFFNPKVPKLDLGGGGGGRGAKAGDMPPSLFFNG